MKPLVARMAEALFDQDFSGTTVPLALAVEWDHEAPRVWREPVGAWRARMFAYADPNAACAYMLDVADMVRARIDRQHARAVRREMRDTRMLARHDKESRSHWQDVMARRQRLAAWVRQDRASLDAAQHYAREYLAGRRDAPPDCDRAIARAKASHASKPFGVGYDERERSSWYHDGVLYVLEALREPRAAWRVADLEEARYFLGGAVDEMRHVCIRPRFEAWVEPLAIARWPAPPRAGDMIGFGKRLAEAA